MEVISSGHLDKQLEEQTELLGAEADPPLSANWHPAPKQLWYLTPEDSDQENRKRKDVYSEKLY